MSNLSVEQPVIFRICPRCQTGWEDKNEWMNDTVPKGQETREVASGRLVAQSLWKITRYAIRVEVRAHRGCDGQMLDEGTVIGELGHSVSAVPT